MRHNPADPATTVSATLVMMGIGATFRPTRTGLTFAHISGTAFTATGAVSLTIGARYGTGAPPVNGAAVSGTPIGTDLTLIAASAVAGVGFCLADHLGLVPGTMYWLDLALSTTNASDAAAAKSISALLVEQL